MIYLDNNATTKPFPEVLEAMNTFMSSRYWSASSPYGQMDGLDKIVESATCSILELVGGAREDRVIFTSGATEANAWAVSEGMRRAKGRGWALSSEIEHPSVSETIDYYHTKELPVRHIPVTRDGVIDLCALEAIVDSDLCFATLILAHNETGVIQPLREAAALIRKKSPECLIHTDATQAIGKIPIACEEVLNGIDLLSFSGHKFQGPKGIGGLILRNQRGEIQPLIRGGGQQDNYRSGTLNIPGIAGIGVAAKKNSDFLHHNQQRLVLEVRNQFEVLLKSSFPGVIILGSSAERLPNTSFFGIPDINADDLVYCLAAEGVAVSKGSACASSSIKPSEVAGLMRYSYDEAVSLIRFSASWDTTPDDVVEFFSVLKKHKLVP